MNPTGHLSVLFGQPSGFGPGALGEEHQQQPTWSNNDDVHIAQPNTVFPGPGPMSSIPGMKKLKQRRQWKWPWMKEVEFKSECIAVLNNFGGEMNDKFCSNYVSTSRYNMVTFVPRFLFSECAT